MPKNFITHEQLQQQLDELETKLLAQMAEQIKEVANRKIDASQISYPTQPLTAPLD